MTDDRIELAHAANEAFKRYEVARDERSSAALSVAMLVSDLVADGRLGTLGLPADLQVRLDIFHASWQAHLTARDEWREIVAALDAPPSPVT